MNQERFRRQGPQDLMDLRVDLADEDEAASSDFLGLGSLNLPCPSPCAL